MPSSGADSPLLSNPAPCLWRLPVGLTTTAGPIHTTCFVGINKQVENPLRCQAFMPVDVDGRVADAECFADVGFFFNGASRQLYGVRFVRQGDAEAVFAPADE